MCAKIKLRVPPPFYHIDDRVNTPSNAKSAAEWQKAVLQTL
jgi:hypothetical protein